MVVSVVEPSPPPAAIVASWAGVALGIIGRTIGTEAVRGGHQGNPDPEP